MILDTTTRKIQLFLSGATTNPCFVTVDYVDYASGVTTPGVQATLTSGASTVDILAAPAASTQRKVNLITVQNADIANITVTIQYYDNATTYEVIRQMTIAPENTLQYTDREGWTVIGSTGGIKKFRDYLYTDFTANGTWYKPGNARFFLIECVGGGGGGGAGQAAAASTNARGGGGGGGGACRTRQLFLAKDLPSSFSVVVGSDTSVAAGTVNGTGAAGSVGNNTYIGSSLSTAYLIGYGGGGGAGGGQTANTGGGGGGGGGGTGAGSSSTTSATAIGGPAFALSVTATLYADARGAAGGAAAAAGSSSFMGGGGGGGGSITATGNAGGSSWFSSGAGGGGGGFAAASVTNGAGGAGGASGSLATTSGGGASAGAVGIKGNDGNMVPGWCGQGGAGGGSLATGTGGFGGDGGAPGGGGGGGGAGGIGFAGGSGGKGTGGVVRIWGW